MTEPPPAVPSNVETMTLDQVASYTVTLYRYAQRVYRDCR